MTRTAKVTAAIALIIFAWYPVAPNFLFMAALDGRSGADDLSRPDTFHAS